jgi:hypothetical protein
MRWIEVAVTDVRSVASSYLRAPKSRAIPGMSRSSRWTKERPSGIIPTFGNEPDVTISP